MTDHPPPIALLGPLPNLPDAACKGITYPDVFHPHAFDMDHRFATAQAKAICARCPEQTACLEWAMSENVGGIWGGVDERERRAMKRKASA